MDDIYFKMITFQGIGQKRLGKVGSIKNNINFKPDTYSKYCPILITSFTLIVSNFCDIRSAFRISSFS